jgi:hypothetical protein
MSLFSFPPNEVITSYSAEDWQGPQTGVVKAARGPGGARALFLATDSRTKVDLADQFIVFQLSNQIEGPSILESSQVTPKIEGARDEPDVLVALEMLSFHTGANEQIDPDARATMRINFGKDESSTDKRFDTVFWSIAAGLKLYDQVKNQKAESKEFRTDFHKAFGNRPIEIPGGLGKLSFEVVKHREPAWWQRIFKFLQSDIAKNLVSVLGFPAITIQAIGVLDELLNRLTDSEPEVLFKSLPMRLALSKYARDEFTGGNPRVKIGTLNQGFCVMARGRDFETVSSANAIYYPTYGKLVPQNVSDADLLAGNYDDPLRDVTYAVFRVGMKSAKLDPTFNYTS